jgi:ribonuclease Y
LQDIGKALTHEVEGLNLQIGVDIARKYKENVDIIHAIEADQKDVEPVTTIACIKEVADAISKLCQGLEVRIKRTTLKG